MHDFGCAHGQQGANYLCLTTEMSFGTNDITSLAALVNKDLPVEKTFRPKIVEVPEKFKDLILKDPRNFHREET